ncbi:MAG: hypothetical protein Hyperionvirus9_31 [Hyperionvirus sp.]|uniref:Uncharacterized protein n=1 Tax=Hyperionvirus sp. TaxID=2487770 RepID=A0A3G5AAM8_9VIRU|nr:MAG: hypothetical protein Hyperionvirus9_31 [Hyperionvirus sp.]
MAMEKKDLTILHKGFDKLYQSIPFLWNYADMLMPYEVKLARALSGVEMRTHVVAMDKTKGEAIIKILDKMDEIKDETEYYLNVQYKNLPVWYMNKDLHELYISFHTWLYRKDLGVESIVNEKDEDYEYEGQVGIFPLTGKLFASVNYPAKYISGFSKGRKKCIKKIACGIAINDFCEREIYVHYANKYVRFSPHDSCNFIVGSDNVSFVSIIRGECGSCVTLHLFRNVGDNNPDDEFLSKIK